MSVWSSSVQKLDIAKLIYESLGDRIDQILGPEVYPYLRPSGSITPVRKDDTWEDMATICKWKNPRELDIEDSKIAEVLDKRMRWFVGLEAVYQIVHAVFQGRFLTKDAYPYDDVDHLSTLVGTLVTPSTQITPAKFLKEWQKGDPAALEIGKRMESASEAFKHMRLNFDARSNDVKDIDQRKFFGAGRRCYFGWTIGNLCIMHGAHEYANRNLCFTRAHVDILVEVLSRLGNTYFHLATQYANEPDTMSAISEMVSLQVRIASRAKKENANYAVKAFHKARAYAQMVMQENKHRGALADAVADYEADGLDQILKLDEYLAIVSRVPVQRRTEVLQVYKWMPPPDFDATYAFADLHKWHTNPRPSGADDVASEEAKRLWESVKVERKMNLAAAYRQLTGQWPEELGCSARGPTLAQCAVWEPEALFAYHQYGTDIVTQIKDKATVEASFEAEWKKKPSDQSQSFLLWYMENAGKIDTKKDLIALAKGGFEEDNYVRVAYKSEGHKPGSRLFHIAPPRQRILLGEFEGNLSRIAAAYPGSLQGKGTSDKERIVSSIMDLSEDPPGTQDSEGFEVFVITFDLSKFSPKSNFAVTKDYHDFWAKVYGVPELSALASIGCKARIMHTTAGLKMSYTNPGADLEGFRGRMQTMFHSDMLAASCRLAKERGYLQGKGVLGVFIDDGAVKVAVTGTGHEANQSINGFLECMQAVYAACGQENHPNKTQISDKGGELLAEQFYNGVKLPTPIKAAQRLAPDYENAAASIAEEFDALFAASQGCVKDGGDWIQTYKRYVVSVIKSIHRWGRRHVSLVDLHTMAVKILTPKSYGGFGLQPLQGLVSTASVNLTVEGFGMLNRAARMYPAFRPLVKRVVTKEVIKRDPLSVLRDPSRIRAEGPVLIENRLMMRVVKWLESQEGTNMEFMKAYRDLELKEHAEAVARAILSKDSVSIPMIQRAWKITPLAYVESVVSKFRRSATIIKLIGNKEMSGIRRKNMKDVEAVLLEFN